MTAPLALFLTHFTAAPPPVEFVEFADEPPEPESEPSITLLVADFEERLAAAAEGAKAEAEQRHETETAALAVTHEEATAEALATARAEWIELEAEGLAAALDAVASDLRTVLADGIANVLRPFLADALIARTKMELLDALDRLLADPSQPLLSVRCPEDMGVALRAARPDAGIEWIVADTAEVTVVADATRIETQLTAALADLAATEV